MELTANQKLVHQMYIAYYQRPADPEGLKYWVDQLETYQDWTVISAAFGAPENAENQALYGSKSREEVIAEIYQSAFDRAAVAEEISFWANSEFSLTNLAFAIINGAQNDDLATVNAKVAFSHELVAQVDPVGNGDPADYEVPFTALDGIDLLKDVNKDTDVTPEYVEQAVASQINPNSVFTLTENVVTTVTPAVEGEVLTKMVTYWGFNPHGHGETDVDNLDGNNPDGNDNNLTNEGPADGGVPVSEFLKYIATLADGTHLQALLAKFEDVGVDLGAIAIDQDTPDFSSVTSLTLGGDGDSNANAMTIGFENDAGEFASAVVELSDYMFDLISSLIFDEEGNSRLFEVEVPVTSYWLADSDDGVDLPTITVDIDGQNVEVYADSDGEAIEIPFVYGAKDAVENESIVPIVLTPTENNGGTEEHGKTSDANDLIVAARLDLLHGAYIDAGGGENTLEIDAKGYYAQPKALIGIQTISIQNLPNVYTDGSGSSDYPDLVESAITEYNDSIIDISRATDLENLSVSASDFDALEKTVTSAGDLTVAGIRNGATVTLDGHFGDDSITLNFRETADTGVNLVLHNVNFDEGTLNLAHNAPTLNIESAGAGNVIEDANIGNTTANLMTLNITGEASLYISGDIGDAFAEGHPAVIDASGNTGGVDLTVTHDDEIVFTGTAAADDHFTADADRSVTITGGEGNGEYDATAVGDVVITAGNGNNEIYATSTGDDANENEDTVTVVVGDGQNDITVASSDAFSITAGNGDNRIEAEADAETGVTESDVSTIVLGDGQNEVDAKAPQLSIVAGNGNNEIEATNASGDGTGTVAIEAGDGDNTIEVNDFEVVTVTTGAGNDALTVTGGNINYADGGTTEEDNENGNETLLTIDLGAGVNTLQLGNDTTNESGVTAVDGSTITGENITLVVQDDSDISRADVSGVTAVQMGSGDVLTLSLTQFIEMGGSASFSTIGESFAANSVLNIIVDQSTSLDDLNIEALPRSIDLSFEVMDGVTLEMTAQQLHERVTDGGVTAYNDGGNVDLKQGTVFITDAGENFDPYDTGLTGSIDENAADLHLRLDARPGGYERPAEATSYTRLQINTDDLVNGEQTPFDTHHTFLRIIGESDFNFTPVEDGLDEWGQPIPNAGDSILLGDGTESFKVDFSAVSGTVTGLTLDHFENVDAIYGNGGARVDVKLKGNVATDEAGLISKGVSTYVVTAVDTVAGTVDIDGSPVSTDANEVYFFTCETTKDLEVLGLQGNYGATVHFDNTERGVEFLMEVEYAKADGYVVGTLNGEFARPGAAAIVNVVGLDALPAGETQKVAGIELINAATATINVEGGNTEIEALDTGAVTELTVNADANLTLPELDADLEVFDASGVVGELTTSIDPENSDAGLVFVGAAGATSLTIENAGEDAIDAITGAGEISLTIGDGTGSDAVNLSEASLANITSVTLDDTSTLTLTMEQADQIGAENFHVAEGESATLSLLGLNDQEFALANYDVEGTLNVTLTLANEPVVTLHPNTDLTGINALAIPAGTTLELTMAQFQQLNNEGTLTGAGSVHITDVMQADVGEAGVALDLTNVNLTGTDSTVTLSLGESVDLSDAAISGPAIDVINFGDDMTLTVGNFEDLDGVEVNGGANSVVVISDSSAPSEGVDASGWSFSEVHFLNVVAGGVNVDEDLFVNLPESIEKVVYNGEGTATPVAQVATIQAQTSVDGSYTAFNKSGADQDTVEIVDFTLNLEGGVYIAGDIELSTDEKFNPDNGDYLLTQGLQTVTINSVGTEANLMNDETANVINGALTPMASNIAWENNTLLDVVINAEQALQINGGIVFNSWAEGDLNDGWTINDNAEASATVTINGTADVALGVLDTSDNDVDALTVNNAGTGTVSATIDGSASGFDTDDALAFTGSNIELTIKGIVNLSDDDLSGVSSITLADGSELEVTFSQLTTLGVDNLVGTPGNVTEDLTINGYDGSAFDFTTIDQEIDFVALVLDGSDVTLDPSVNLTGVDQINANGGSLTLTAAQFQQLSGNGLINNATAVTITGLTQADIDSGAFDLSSVSASANLTVELAEDVNLSADDNIENADLVSIGAFHLGLATHAQADDLVVSGDAASIVTLLFDLDFLTDGEIEAAGYDVGTLRAIAETVAGLDAEVVFDNLRNSVELSLYETAEEVGYVSAIHRTVTIEDGVAVPGNLIFNGQDDSREMRTLTINFEGDANDGRTVLEDQDGNLEGSVLNGDLVLHRTQEDTGLTPLMFQTLTLNSFGDGDSNAITGDIHAQGGAFMAVTQTLTTAPVDTDVVSITVNGTAYSVTADIPTTHNDSTAVLAALETLIEAGENIDVTVGINSLTLESNSGVPFEVDSDLKSGNTTSTNISVSTVLENNLLDVVINADSEFAIGGAIVFSSVDADDATASLTVNGDADVTIESLDVSDTDVDTLDVTVNGASTLTVTGASPSITGPVETINLSGSVDSALYFGTADNDLEDGIEGSETLSVVNASALEGTLTIEAINHVNEESFTFTSGTGVTTVTFTEDNLHANGAYTFDFTNAADNSALHFNPDWGTPADFGGSATSSITVLADASTTIHIDKSIDFSDINASLPVGATIVVADGQTLTLTAAQANGLTIVGANGTASTGVVNIVDLGDDPVDLSLIDTNIAGTATLVDNDVTLDVATDLGEFSITLLDVADGVDGLKADELQGQTIRFQTVDQAEREIIVGLGGDSETLDGVYNGDASTNVVWLFDSIVDAVNTDQYDPDLARLWFTQALANGADVEDLFTSLPSTILRVDFADLSELEELLTSLPVDRKVELASFTTLGDGLEFNDSDVLEHVETLTISMGGQVTVGDIALDNIIDNTGTYTTPPTFNGLTINSVLADDTGDLLARENFDEEVHVKPTSGNTVGDISVGTVDNNIDLLNVTLNTGAAESGNDTTADSGINVLTGTSLTVGDITFDSEEAGSIATLTVTGDNDVTIKSIDTSDADITTLTVDTSGHTGTYTVTGGSPAAAVSDTETFNINTATANPTITITADASDEGDETMTVEYVLNGVAGSVEVDLSAVDVTDAAAVATAVASDLNAIVGISAASVAGVVTVSKDATEEPVSFAITGTSVDGTTVELAGAVSTNNGVGAAYFGTAMDTVNGVPYAGVAGNELSELTVSGLGYVDLGTIAQIDSTDDDSDDDGIADQDAFILNGNGAGTTVARLGAANVDGAVVAPTLAAEQTWEFNNVSLTITEDVTFTPGATPAEDPTLQLNNVELTMEGDVDLTRVNLEFTGVNIHVPEGESLTLTVAQLADVSLVTGEGTVFIEGEIDTDAAVTLNLVDKIQTVGIDLSGLTNVGVIVPQANPVTVTLDTDGAIDDNGDAAGFNVVGSDFNDAITGSGKDDTFNMGEGDDEITGGLGGDTFIVEDGTDTITDLFADGSSQVDDVLVVSADAEVVATGITNFTASAGTINNGTATLTAAVNGTIDVALAGGDNGFNLNGTTGTATLTGSANDDIINGGDGDSVQDGVDILTGNGGADQFVFNVDVDSSITFTKSTTGMVDRETITLVAADGNDSTVSQLTVNYTIGGTNANVVVDLSGVTATDLSALRTAVVQALQGKAGISATEGTDPGVIVVSGDNSQTLEITSLAWAGTGNYSDTSGVDTSTSSVNDDTLDTAQVTTLTVEGDATAGDVYDLLITGTSVGGTATYTAITNDGGAEVAAGLVTGTNGYDDIPVEMQVEVNGNVITYTDLNSENGGFDVVPNAIYAFGGSGASADTAAIDTADIITDFTSGTDRVVFNGLVDGSLSNYAELAQQNDETAAFNAATAAFDGTVQYFLTSIEADSIYAATQAAVDAGVVEGDTLGLLYFDANMDEEVDGVVVLLGVDATTFAATDIFGAVA